MPTIATTAVLALVPWTECQHDKCPRTQGKELTVTATGIFPTLPKCQTDCTLKNCLHLQSVIKKMKSTVILALLAFDLWVACQLPKEPRQLRPLMLSGILPNEMYTLSYVYWQQAILIMPTIATTTILALAPWAEYQHDNCPRTQGK